MEKIILTNNLIENIKVLSKALKEKSLEEFSKMLKEKSEQLNIDYNILLELILSRDSLHDIVLNHTSKIDKEIDNLEEQLQKLKDKKYQLGSLLCELHGHEYGEREICDSTYCKNCGKKTLLRGAEGNKYYRDLNKRNTPIYQKKKKSY